MRKDYRDLAERSWSQPVGTSGGSSGSGDVSSQQQVKQSAADSLGATAETFRNLGGDENSAHQIIQRAFQP